ncbi:helix-turn-helix transcriptional regulator [Myxococcus sp. CA056]|uniref:helix-turn-helix domain-containing protein n=1 Tax=Myxococcus sp. CA056 TaxID=2741740 RepID=UPI001C2D08CA|nr:AraC family transcriptional regulator [Myxococcus sp. CA056]NTX11356.1 helix-turn-helix transcriptional regulator [Myxococcus sp. CA056]
MGMRIASLEAPPVADRVVRRAVSGRRVERGLRHHHPDFELTWVEAGRVEFELASGKLLVASDGACIVLPPGAVVTPRVRVAALQQIMVPASIIAVAAMTLGLPVHGPLEPLVLGADDRLAQLIRLFMEEASEGASMKDPLIKSLSDATVFGVARGSLHSPPPGAHLDRRIRRVLATMNDGYRERLSVEDLARVAGMSRYALLHVFRAQVGASPYQHLTTLRLERAAEQLRAARTPSVLEVALACGFTDPGRFARAFRARYGCSPREYRVRASNGAPFA